MGMITPITNVDIYVDHDVEDHVDIHGDDCVIYTVVD